LTARHERLDVQPFLKDGKYRAGNPYAERTLKTVYGKVTYGRRYLQSCQKGHGIFPLDMVLGLTWDALSPWVMQWVAQLATRMSFKAAQMVCKAVLNWAPATETIEQVVLGMGRHAAPFMEQLKTPAQVVEGEVLVIEVDGKCPPTATAAELAKRRGKRKPKHLKDCPCGCQRHRGKAKRQARGSKNRPAPRCAAAAPDAGPGRARPGAVTAADAAAVTAPALSPQPRCCRRRPRAAPAPALSPQPR
jgi:hypothetical protein